MKATTRHYPWVIAVIGMLMLLMSNGLTATGLTAFDPSLLGEFGWTRAEFKFRDALTFWMAGLLAPLVGLLVDRFNPRWLLIGGLLALTVGYVAYGLLGTPGARPLFDAIAIGVALTYAVLAWFALRAWAPLLRPWMAVVLLGAVVGLALWGYAAHWRDSSLHQLYVIHLLFVIAVCCAGGAFVIVLVCSWFVRHRGLALGIALVGTSLGSALLPNLTARLIEAHGWRTAFHIEALLPLVLLVVVALTVRGLPRHAGVRAVGQAAADADLKEHGMTLHQAVRTRTFWAICVSGFLTYFAIFGFVQHLVLHMTKSLGYTLQDAAHYLLLFSLLAMTTKLLGGVVADRADRRAVFLVSLGIMLGGLLLLSTLDRTWLMPAVIAIGIGWGALFTLYSMLAVGSFGLREIGRINGFVNLFETFGVGTGSWLIGWLFDLTGDYHVPFLVLAGATGIGMLLGSQVRTEIEPPSTSGVAPSRVTVTVPAKKPG
jgi:sugar phosphate permease